MLILPSNTIRKFRKFLGLFISENVILEIEKIPTRSVWIDHSNVEITIIPNPKKRVGDNCEMEAYFGCLM
jgi:hypothetical protein